MPPEIIVKHAGDSAMFVADSTLARSLGLGQSTPNFGTSFPTQSPSIIATAVSALRGQVGIATEIGIVVKAFGVILNAVIK